MGDVGRGIAGSLPLFKGGERGVGSVEPLLRRCDFAWGGGALGDKFLQCVEIMLRLVAVHLRLGQFAGKRIALLLRAALFRGLIVCLRTAQRGQRTGAVRDRIRIIQRQQELSLRHEIAGFYIKLFYGARRRSMRLEIRAAARLCHWCCRW